ncbi:hypothetical protein T492DRAFT_859541, partial [Pavlovales sp. CCMP2436]
MLALLALLAPALLAPVVDLLNPQPADPALTGMNPQNPQPFQQLQTEQPADPARTGMSDPQPYRPHHHFPPIDPSAGGGGGDVDPGGEAFIAVLAPSQHMAGRSGQPLLIPGRHYEVRWISHGKLGLLRVELHQASADSA